MRKNKKKSSKKKSKRKSRKKNSVAKKIGIVSHGSGRPRIITEDDKKTALSLAEEGLTKKQIADRLGVDRTTVWRLEESDHKFRNALKAATKVACETVQRSLFESATGYSCPETVIKVINGKIHTLQITKHYPPSVEAQKFYLKNRDPENWKDRLEQDIKSDGKSIEEMIYLAYESRKMSNGRR